ncbi:MAG: dTMP kinase [Marmoricola sp.]
MTSAPGLYAESGLFVCFEGGEGAGKSTQARLLRDWLAGAGHEVVLTHEPGDTAVGKEIRRVLLDPATGALAPRAEALLYAADKAEHLAQVVWPALRRGAVVVTDRYVDSTLAYQGAGRDLVLDDLEPVVRWATGDLRPHLTVLLDLEPEAGLGRFEERDRMEGESLAFHRRVREGFLDLARRDPSPYLVLDARMEVEELRDRIRDRIQELLGSHP